MNRTKKYFLPLIMFIVGSCTSDYKHSLGNGYAYIFEGGNLNQIICEDLRGSGIPASVVDYTYNQDFIIAKQVPQLPQSILEDRLFSYSKGDSVFYYWLILKKEYKTIGPMDSLQFQKEINKRNINLEFNSL